MLRLVLLVIYLAASYTAGQPKVGRNLDPDGLMVQPPSPTVDNRGNLDPDGLAIPATPDVKAGLDPNG